MVQNRFLITRTYWLRLRPADQAWWQATQQADGSWNVHFHADYVPSTDWVAAHTADMFDKIQVEMEEWITALHKKFPGNA